MPSKAVHERPNVTEPPLLDKSSEQTSILIFISAKALGSLGFAVSLLAIWFGWLLPASMTAPVLPPEELEHKKPRSPSKHPHRPTSHAVNPLAMPARRASAPVNLTPILAHNQEEVHNSTRRVYFSDMSPAPITRRNTMPEKPQDKSEGQTLYQTVLSTVNGSPVSPTSVLPTPDSPPASEYMDDITRESDSSLQSCKASLLKSASRLQKLKLSFHVKHNRQELLGCDQSSIASTETAASEKSTRRASGSFVTPWAISRNRTTPDVAVEATLPPPSRLSFTRRRAPSRPATSPATTSAAHDLLSPTFLSRKAHKRMSAPIPRTSPYGAPYFATPPLLISHNDNYPAYLRGLPQFEDEVQFGRSRNSESSERSRGRNTSLRRVSLNPEATVHKRSASEDWTPKQNIHS
ncbi:hypothetical protein CPB84DRAFT_1842742 [Gymnopilus junonius]|uniref:Uncharacterized protein n=1 Tax=Gymnopilus junonius TaxID=109634 RepID=A0A9P5TT25_GYMJU|nr:hypothetical protein CPB84DRAFT_1842742 [Gymnopilus junonius]